MAGLIGTFCSVVHKRVPSAVEHTPTQNIDTLKNWTGKANAKITLDSPVDEFTDNGLLKKEGQGKHRGCWVHDKGRLVWLGQHYGCLGTGDIQRRPFHIRLLVRVTRTVSDTTEIHCQGRSEERHLCQSLGT